MKKRIGELEEFEFEPLTQGRSLHVTVAVSGWLNDKHTGLCLIQAQMFFIVFVNIFLLECSRFSIYDLIH